MESLRIAMFLWESLRSAKVCGMEPHITELSDKLVEKSSTGKTLPETRFMFIAELHGVIKWKKCV